MAGASDQAEYGAAAAENSYSAPVPPPVTEVKIFQKYFPNISKYSKKNSNISKKSKYSKNISRYTKNITEYSKKYYKIFKEILKNRKKCRKLICETKKIWISKLNLRYLDEYTFHHF